jgi:adenosylcobinamide-GDP ribazoletransferase
MPVAGRWAMVFAITAFPYARQEGLGRVFKENANGLALIIATVVTLLAAVVLLRWAGLMIMVVAAGIVAGAAAFCNRRFAGLTGDNYGALNEIAEVTVLLLVTGLLHTGWSLF